MWLGIHWSNKFLQSFRFGGVSHARRDSKQYVSYIRNELLYEVDFLHVVKGIPR